MEGSLFLRGMMIGFAIAAPVGPIGLLCIQRTLQAGRLSGLATGMGAATADAVYGLIAGFGLTVVASALVEYRVPLGLIGGAFLCVLGTRTLLTAPATSAPTVEARGLLTPYITTFLLTLTNPMTIFSFFVIFAGMGLASIADNSWQTVLLVAGVFAGSALWWLLLSAGAALLRTRLRPRVLRTVNLVAGAVIVGFGVTMIVGAVR